MFPFSGVSPGLSGSLAGGTALTSGMSGMPGLSGMMADNSGGLSSGASGDGTPIGGSLSGGGQPSSLGTPLGGEGSPSFGNPLGATNSLGLAQAQGQGTPLFGQPGGAIGQQGNSATPQFNDSHWNDLISMLMQRLGIGMGGGSPMGQGGGILPYSAAGIYSR
jgi:hypothetical protein